MANQVCGPTSVKKTHQRVVINPYFISCYAARYVYM